MLVGLAVYALVIVVVLVAPVSFSGIVNRIGEVLGSAGFTGFGTGWIEFFANILIFAPLGFFLTLLFRHPLVGTMLALVLSVAAEIAQIVIPSRQPSLRDVLANALGAAVGAAIAWLLLARRRSAGRRQSALSSRESDAQA